MFSKSQNLYKSPPRANSTIIPNSFDIKIHAQPHNTLRIPQKPQIKFKNQKKYLKFGKFGLTTLALTTKNIDGSSLLSPRGMGLEGLPAC